MLEDVRSRLESFGYTLTDSDVWMITFITDKVENDIKRDCNISEIPEGLLQVEVDMVCGEFLQNKQSTGTLDLNLEDAVKSIQEGDTQVTYEVGSTLTADFLISYLMNHGRSAFANYRCIKW